MLVMTALGFGPNLDGYWDVSTELVRHVNARTRAAIERARADTDRISDAAQARAYQQRVRAAVLDGLGGLPDADTPLDIEWLGAAATPTGQDAGYRIERLIFHSSPGVPVTANLYRPAGVTAAEPGPAVLFVCGHSETGKAYPRYQAVCAALARTGITVLTFDPIGQGERSSYLDADSPWAPPAVQWGTSEHSYAGLASWWLGRSVARWFVHDARRAIDVLAGLPEVDPTRIGITGNSGGGTLCTLMMVLEPRLAAAAPGTFVTSRGHYLWSGQVQDAEQIIPAGTERGVDHDDMLAVMAPRPVLVLAAEYDFFPYEGAIESVARARRIFDLLGNPDALRLVSGAHTHEYSADLADAAVAFFAEVFGLAAPECASAPAGEPAASVLPAVLPARQLWCTASGQVAVDRPESRFVHDLEVADYRRLRQDAGEAGENGDGERMRSWLHGRVHAHRRRPDRPYTRWLPGLAETQHAFWRSEVDLWGAGVLVDHAPAAAPGQVWLGLLHDGTDDLHTGHRLLDLTDALLLVPDLRGQGALRQHERTPTADSSSGGSPASLSLTSTVFKLDCDLLWLDDSLAAGRIFDVTRALDMLLGDPALRSAHPWLGEHTKVHLYGEGLGAFHAVLAATVDERVASVRITDPVVDPDRLITCRLWDDGRGAWQGLIPGLAVQAPLAHLERMLGDRLQRD